jgi:hypothetical protein
VSGLVEDMHSERVLEMVGTELPKLIRQLRSSDPNYRNAALQRLENFAEMTELWRIRRVARLGRMRPGTTFVAMSSKPDD